MKIFSHFDKDVFLHLRLPFSYFLLPVFLFAISQSEIIYFIDTILLFMALHFFIYPGSNLYNSFMDQDTGSIGVLKTPPPVTEKMYRASIYFDSLGLLIALVADYRLFLMMIPYILVSKIYSWHGIRLKKYPVTGWLAVILFQGGYTFLMVYLTSKNFILGNEDLFIMIYGFIISALLIGAYYPLTQVYQHNEDRIHGDLTLSRVLGIRGTFYFTAVLFTVSIIFAWIYFSGIHKNNLFSVFALTLIPAGLYFLIWFKKVYKNPDEANFSSAMRMTFISSTVLNFCFLLMLLKNSPVII